MNDFLSHLVARTIAEPTLRPRTRSRFEAPTVEEATLVWPATTQAPERRPEPPAERRHHVTFPSTREESSPHPARPREVLRPSPRPQVGPPTAPPPAPAPVVTASPAVDTPRSDAGDGRLPIVETTERVTRLPAERPHRFDDQPPQVERHEPREIEHAHHGRVIHTTTIDRRRRVLERSQPPEPAAKPEPIIQVSIGRIEVRAVPPAPQARTASRSAAMTIDDYVAKREAKQRR
jgi:hypothetical protein